MVDTISTTVSAREAEVLAALGVYGGVYTCIGVAHAMQGPRRKWRPRLVLLTAAFGMAAAAHIAALPVVAILGLMHKPHKTGNAQGRSQPLRRTSTQRTSHLCPYLMTVLDSVDLTGSR